MQSVLCFWWVFQLVVDVFFFENLIHFTNANWRVLFGSMNQIMIYINPSLNGWLLSGSLWIQNLLNYIFNGNIIAVILTTVTHKKKLNRNKQKQNENCLKTKEVFFALNIKWIVAFGCSHLFIVFKEFVWFKTRIPNKSISPPDRPFVPNLIWAERSPGLWLEFSRARPDHRYVCFDSSKLII